MATAKVRSFDELWTAWNHPLTRKADVDEKVDLLQRCLVQASTFEELQKVHSATFGAELDYWEFQGLSGVRTKSLQELIDITKNRHEAEVAFKLASRKKKNRRFRFPAKVKAARARLEDFPKKD